MDKKKILIGVLVVVVAFLVVYAIGLSIYSFRPAEVSLEERYDPSFMRTVSVQQEVMPDSPESAFEQKIIYTGQMEVDVEDVDETYDTVSKLVEEKGGYISESRFWEQFDGAQKNLRLVLRVPAETFDNTLSQLTDLGRVVDQSTRGQDVTEQYYDLEVRLENKKRQEERYLEVLDMATTVEEILKVERELERIRGDIESMEGRFRYLKDQVSLATITLIARETHTPSAFISTFKEAFSSLLESIKSMIFFGATVLPWIIVILLLVWLVSAILRSRKG